LTSKRLLCRVKPLRLRAHLMHHGGWCVAGRRAGGCVGAGVLWSACISCISVCCSCARADPVRACSAYVLYLSVHACTCPHALAAARACQELLGLCAAPCVHVLWALPRGAPARAPGLHAVASLLVGRVSGAALASAVVRGVEGAPGDYECAVAGAILGAMMASGVGGGAAWPLERVEAVARARGDALGPTAELLLARVAIARTRL
jgi:hypothetical protein